MNKIIKKIICCQVLILLIINLYPVNILAASSNIVSIQNLSTTVKLHQKYVLPNTITATMSDKTVKKVSVIWDKKTLDTSKVGTYTFRGTVTGYKPKVTLIVKVILDNPNTQIMKKLTEIPSIQGIYDKWSYKKETPFANETKFSTIKYVGSSTIIFTQSCNDTKKAVKWGNKIIYVHNDGKVKEYDPVADSWEDKYEIYELRNSNGDFMVVTIGELIYIIGVNFTDILVYNPLNNQCTLETKLLSTKRVGGAVATNGKIYILGGFDGLTGNTSNSLEEYDPSSGKWSIKANMKEGTNTISTTALNDKIYCLGESEKNYNDGTTFTQTLEVYDIKNDIWTTKTATSSSQILNDSLEAVNNRIYAVYVKENSEKNSYKICVDEYNPDTNTWKSRASSMSTERNKFASVEFNGEIYILGGVKDKKPKGTRIDFDDLKANPAAWLEYVKTIEKYTPPKS